MCKGHACHILFSYIIMKSRHETNCWSWFWVYKFDQKWKILKIQKKFFFLYFQNFSFLIGFLHPKSWQTICLMSWLHDYIRKKYVSCIFFAYQGIIFKKIAIFFFLIFKIFHFWSDFYTQNHDQQFVSCLNFMIVYKKSMCWYACPSHTKAYKNPLCS